MTIPGLRSLEYHSILPEPHYNNGFFNHKRQNQAKYWMYETINQELKRTFSIILEISKEIKKLEKEVTDGSLSPFKAAHLLLAKTLKREFD